MLRFGNTRELVLGLEVVLADGRVWDGLRGLRKDNTGYDLKQLFIGAEGTLGIVTAAVLKLFPAPRARVTALAARRRRRRRGRACSRALQAGAGRPAGRLRADVARCRSRCRASTIRRCPIRCPATRGTRWSRPTTARADAPLAGAGRGGARGGARSAASSRDAAIAQSGEQARALWALRENIAEAQRREGPNIKHDISLPVSAIPAFLDDAASRAGGRASRRCGSSIFGHLGDGNLHYNLAGARGRRARRRSWRTRARANRIVHDLVAAHGGSISAEHGIGQLKRDELVRYKSAVELELMRASRPRSIRRASSIPARCCSTERA